MQRADILQMADGGGIMPDWLPPILGTLDIAAFAALIIGVMWNARETRRSTYINLETEALNIFRFEAEHRIALKNPSWRLGLYP